MVSCIKTLYIPSYKSTDFEVHRNWLAITSSLPYTKWYTEKTSEWTLDYPPYFAWFEFLLSRIALYFDPEMLKVDNLNYSSWMTIMFQRLSVIVTDLVFALGVKSCADHLPPILGKTAEKHLGLLDPSSEVASMTGGLVQDISHTILPNISPLATAVITLLSMLPALVKLWLSPHSVTQFLRCLVLCAWSSFLFGWHVHEKAVLLIILPLAILALVSKQEAKYYIITSITGHFSLFPLLYGAVELPSKLFLHLSHSLLATNTLTTTSFCWWEKLYLCLSIPVFLWSEVLHSTTGLDSRLPFLPLLLYSLYAAGGIISTYCRIYRNFLLA